MQINKKYLIVVISVLGVLAAVWYAYNTRLGKRDNVTGQPKQTNSIADTTQTGNVVVQVPTTPPQNQAQVYAMYDAEITALDTFAITNYCSVYDVVNEFDRIRGFSFNKATTDSICQQKDSLLRSKLIKIEALHFAQIRKIHIENLNKHKWDFDVTFSTIGPANTQLMVYSRSFSVNSNLVAVHDLIENDVFRLRFKKIHFKHENNVEVIETNSPDDDEL